MMTNTEASSYPTPAHEWFDRVWNQQDLTAVDEIMSDSCEIVGLGHMAIGKEGFLETFESFRNTFERMRIEVVDCVVNGDEMAGHSRFTALHKESGKEVDMVFSFAGRYADGQLVWTRNTVDYTALLTQIGRFDMRSVGEIFS